MRLPQSAHSGSDAAVENIVGRSNLEPTISAARWQVQAEVDLEKRQLVDFTRAS